MHIYKSNARHAVRFKIFGFRCEIYPHRSSCHFLQTGLPLSECNKTKPEEQCSISFSHGAFRYLVILHTQPCLTLYIYTRSLSEGSRDIPSLNLAITYPSRAQQKGFDLPRCISCSCAILCSVKNFNSFQMLAHRVLTQLLYNYSIIQQYYEKDQKHRRILQHLEALADKNKKI